MLLWFSFHCIIGSFLFLTRSAFIFFPIRLAILSFPVILKCKQCFVKSFLVEVVFIIFLSFQWNTWISLLIQDYSCRLCLRGAVITRIFVCSRLRAKFLLCLSLMFAWFQDSTVKKMRTALFCVITQQVVVISYQHFTTARCVTTEKSIVLRSDVSFICISHSAVLWQVKDLSNVYVCM